MHQLLQQFVHQLRREEKSAATIEKYRRDARGFVLYLSERELNKAEVVAYKERLTARYAPASVNSMLAAVNRFLRFIDREDCRVRPLKIQRQMFCGEDRELSKDDLRRLLRSAGKGRLSLVIQTLCGTGIRVSELAFITAEAVRAGKAVVSCKSKRRVIFLPAPIQKRLKEYMKKSGITAGPVFVTRNGKPLDRRNIWRDMKSLCVKAGVSPTKVFPHALRHLFARTFYEMEKDIVRLADLLGHSSINTTRIYTIETGSEHRLRMERVEKILFAT